MELKSRSKSGQARFEVDSTAQVWGKVSRNLATTAASYVFILNRHSPLQTKTYLVSTLLDHSFNVSRVDPSGSISFDEDIILLVTCDEHVLQRHAAYIYRPEQLSRQNAGNESSLTVPEQERVLLHLLEAIIQKERSTLVGLDNLTIYPGQSIG